MRVRPLLFLQVRTGPTPNTISSAFERLPMVGHVSATTSNRRIPHHRSFSYRSDKAYSANVPFKRKDLRLAVLAATVIASLILTQLAANPWETIQLESDPPPKQPSLRLISAREIMSHNTSASCWIVVYGTIYDITSFLPLHPGGAGLLLQYAGKDASEIFPQMHPKGTLEKTLDVSTIVGMADPADSFLLVPAESEQEGDKEVDRQKRREGLPHVESVQNVKEFEGLAERVLGEKGRSMVFYRSVAEDGVAFARNLSSFSYIQFRPRVLVPVEEISTVTSFLPDYPDHPTSTLPFFISPAARAGVGHPDGEKTLTRGAARTGITQCISSAASLTLDEIFDEKRRLAGAGLGDANTWFQLYVAKDPAVTTAKVKEAVAGGCTAILVTVDLPVLGKRENDAGSKSGLIGKDPWSIPYDANMTFDVIPWLQKIAPGIPILIKGVATPEDTELAYKAGAAGVLLSNHGGRQLDGAPPPLSTLVRIRQTKPELLDDAPGFSVLLDCGVRRGSDVLKALCLGAKGVGLGRPFLYAQTCYGEEGVVRAVRILEEEIQIGMRLLGARSVAELKPSMVELLDGLVGKDL